MPRKQQVPQRQPKRGRSGWMTASVCGCGRIDGTTSGRVTSWKTAPGNGRKFRTLNVVDEFTREALAIRVAR